MKLAHIGLLYKDINQGINFCIKHPSVLNINLRKKDISSKNKFNLNSFYEKRESPIKMIIKPTVDKKLKVTCCLIGIKKDFFIEIIEPNGNNKILQNKLNNKNYSYGNFDHLCFFSKNIDKDVKYMTNYLNAKLVLKKTYAKLFKKNICFLVVKSLLIELLEV